MKKPTSLILTDSSSQSYVEALGRFNAGHHLYEHGSFRTFFKDELPKGIDVTILYNQGASSLRFITEG